MSWSKSRCSSVRRSPSGRARSAPSRARQRRRDPAGPGSSGSAAAMARSPPRPAAMATGALPGRTRYGGPAALRAGMSAARPAAGGGARPPCGASPSNSECSSAESPRLVGKPLESNAALPRPSLSRVPMCHIHAAFKSLHLC